MILILWNGDGHRVASKLFWTVQMVDIRLIGVVLATVEIGSDCDSGVYSLTVRAIDS